VDPFEEEPNAQPHNCERFTTTQTSTPSLSFKNNNQNAGRKAQSERPWEGQIGAAYAAGSPDLRRLDHVHRNGHKAG